jgi:hypothetical protein
MVVRSLGSRGTKLWPVAPIDFGAPCALAATWVTGRTVSSTGVGVMAAAVAATDGGAEFTDEDDIFEEDGEVASSGGTAKGNKDEEEEEEEEEAEEEEEEAAFKPEDEDDDSFEDDYDGPGDDDEEEDFEPGMRADPPWCRRCLTCVRGCAPGHMHAVLRLPPLASHAPSAY